MKKQIASVTVLLALLVAPSVSMGMTQAADGQPPPSLLLNLSTRLRVLTGENVLIGGFIITGNEPKKVIVRGIGPSLTAAGIAEGLADPTIELHSPDGSVITNDNWKINAATGQSQEAEIRATTIPPSNDLESALVATLAPGAYTTILAGKDQGIGVGVVEVYDLAQGSNSILANISTRGFVDINDKVMIGGFIVGPEMSADTVVLLRVIGPSLTTLGINNALQDPMLELHDSNGAAIVTNDNWKTSETGASQQALIESTTIPPTDDHESAIVRVFSPGTYTAVVRGQSNTTGVAAVEAYRIEGVVIVTVPDVTGFTQAGAANALNGAGLNVAPVAYENNSTVPAGNVIRQAPAAGVSVLSGTAINLVVSLGPADGLPPDPSVLAPPIPPGGSADFASTIKFLYSPPNAIQTGVTPGTIDVLHAAVLKGRVLLRDGSALSGVKISVLNHPEFGQTLSRADGAFDLAVNGGGQLVVKYDEDGYLPVQRSLTTPWRNYATLPDVVLIPYDTAVTTVSIGAPAMQVARANPVTDADGARRATIMVPAGTTADMVMNNGTHVPLNSMHMRATEYTVGDAGPKAMPAALPPSSGYTYCAELSLDEAVANGAAAVVFNQALPTYVENFLGFPIGTAVPTGYYDRAIGEWIASPNGRVIKVLGSTNGLADLDTDGDGLADDTTKLTSLGVTAEERSNIAQLYGAGQSLWRVPVTHFTPEDHNWPYGPPPNAKGGPGPQDNPQTKGDNEQCGSIIGCESQTLGESLAITGSPLRLHYKSDRTPGRKDAYRFTVPVSTAAAPPSGLKAIHVGLNVAGRSYKADFAPASNLTYTVDWDGRDAYGRFLSEPQKATVQVDYDYVPQYYAVRADRDNAFARAEVADVAVSVSRASSTVTLSRTYTQEMGAFDARTTGLDGWSLNIHHRYLPVSGTIERGDGTKQKAAALSAIISTVAGSGSGFPGGGQHSGDGGLATAALLTGTNYLATAPDGSYYINENTGGRIRRVGPDGIINTVVGTGLQGFSGDGGAATAAQLNNGLGGLAVAPDGSLYISDRLNRRIRRVAPNGIITTIAGTGATGSSGDGGLATAATLNDVRGMAFGPDGSLFFADAVAHRIRRIGSDGIITTVAGTGSTTFNGDGIKATTANLFGPRDVAVAADGVLFISEFGSNRIRRVSSDGIITTVAGTGTAGLTGDGGPATSARITSPDYLALAADGTLYYIDGTHRVRVIRDGIINTVTGTGVSGYSGDGGPAASAQIFSGGNTSFGGLAIAPDRSLFIGTNNRVRRIALALPGFTASDFLLPSEDGREVYLFDSNGRHLKSLDALTGSASYQFGYNNAGYLANVIDESGNVTIIERNPSVATAIVASGGQRTSLGADANGWLTSVANPANEAHTMTYSADGLLQTFTQPHGNLHQMTYDNLGRLTQDQDPAGGSTSLARTEQTNGYTITTTSALGRTHVYQVEQLTTGDVRRTVTSTSGAKTITLIGTDSGEQTTLATGDTLTVKYGPDPRWGMLAPVAQSIVVKTPAGLTRTITAARTATLSDPNNLLSLTKLTQTETESGATTTVVYDNATRVTTTTTGAGHTGTVTVDALGRVIQSQIGGLEAVNYSYDSLGRLTATSQGTGAAVRVFAFTYDSKNELISIQDPIAHTAGFAYDPAERLTTQSLPDSTTIEFSYDANGNLTSLTPPSKPAHGFAYTSIDFVSSYTPPDIGIGNTATQYTYDADRTPTQVIRPDGQQVNLTYDPAGRPASMILPRGSITYAYDASDRLVSRNAPGGLGLTYSYDGQLVVANTATGAVSGSVNGSYDTHFRLASISLNGANPIALGYDADDLSTSAGGLTLTRNAQNGLLTGTALGTVSDTRTYNGFAEPASYSASVSGATQLSVQYTRDKLGRITSKIETIAGVTDTYAYAYDLIGRLTGVTRNGAAVEAYTYDANGNRLSATVGGPQKNATYDAQDRLNQYGTTAYTYTASGELATKTNSGQVTTYSYDQLGNLLSAVLPGGTSITYLIDASNRRIGKQVNGTLVQAFLYQSGLRPFAQLDGTGAVVSRFVYATHVNVPDYIIKGGVTYRIVTHQLGSPRLVLDTSSGAVAQRIDYDSIGNVLSDTNPGFQPFGFAGGLYDSDTKLIHFGARDYDAESGRWTCKDPSLFAGIDTNLYGYAGADPINFVDLDGLRPTQAELEAKIALNQKLLSTGLYKDVEADLYKNIDDANSKLQCHDYDPPKKKNPQQKLPKSQPPKPNEPAAPEVEKLKPLETDDSRQGGRESQWDQFRAGATTKSLSNTGDYPGWND